MPDEVEEISRWHGWAISFLRGEQRAGCQGMNQTGVCQTGNWGKEVLMTHWRFSRHFFQLVDLLNKRNVRKHSSKKPAEIETSWKEGDAKTSIHLSDSVELFFFRWIA